MAVLHQCVNDLWMVNVQRTLNCKKKTSTSPTRREKPLIKKKGLGYHRKRERGRERETDGKKEREGWRKDADNDKGG